MQHLIEEFSCISKKKKFFKKTGRPGTPWACPNPCCNNKIGINFSDDLQVPALYWPVKGVHGISCWNNTDTSTSYSNSFHKYVTSLTPWRRRYGSHCTHSHQYWSTLAVTPHWASWRQHTRQTDEASNEGRLARSETQSGWNKCWTSPALWLVQLRHAWKKPWILQQPCLHAENSLKQKGKVNEAGEGSSSTTTKRK